MRSKHVSAKPGSLGVREGNFDDQVSIVDMRVFGERERVTFFWKRSTPFIGRGNLEPNPHVSTTRSMVGLRWYAQTGLLLSKSLSWALPSVHLPSWAVSRQLPSTCWPFAVTTPDPPTCPTLPDFLSKSGDWGGSASGYVSGRVHNYVLKLYFSFPCTCVYTETLMECCWADHSSWK